MRGDVQQIFKTTPPKKQVMMFSATMTEDVKGICRKFMRNQFEIFIDNQSKLTLQAVLHQA
jgi:ATP-dependent RNA helicase UAP56/SUB2